MLILKLPFAVRPGLTDSRFSKDAKKYRLNFKVLCRVSNLVRVVGLVVIARLSRVWCGQVC